MSIDPNAMRLYDYATSLLQALNDDEVSCRRNVVQQREMKTACDLFAESIRAPLTTEQAYATTGAALPSELEPLPASLRHEIAAVCMAAWRQKLGNDCSTEKLAVWARQDADALLAELETHPG